MHSRQHLLETLSSYLDTFHALLESGVTGAGDLEELIDWASTAIDAAERREYSKAENFLRKIQEQTSRW